MDQFLKYIQSTNKAKMKCGKNEMWEKSKLLCEFDIKAYV